MGADEIGLGQLGTLAQVHYLDAIALAQVLVAQAAQVLQGEAGARRIPRHVQAQVPVPVRG